MLHAKQAALYAKLLFKQKQLIVCEKYLIIIAIVLFVVIRKKLRKKRAFELIDDYDYTPSTKIIN
jgi:hypothetical protein